MAEVLFYSRDATSRKLVSENLNLKGYITRPRADIREALATFERAAHDLDFVIADEDGLGLLERIQAKKELRGYTRSPICILWAPKGSYENIRKAQENGVQVLTSGSLADLIDLLRFLNNP